MMPLPSSPIDAGASWQRLYVTGIRDAQCQSNVSRVDPTHGFVAAWDQDHMPVVYRSVRPLAGGTDGTGGRFRALL